MLRLIIPVFGSYLSCHNSSHVLCLRTQGHLAEHIGSNDPQGQLLIGVGTTLRILGHIELLLLFATFFNVTVVLNS